MRAVPQRSRRPFCLCVPRLGHVALLVASSQLEREDPKRDVAGVEDRRWREELEWAAAEQIPPQCGGTGGMGGLQPACGGGASCEGQRQAGGRDSSSAR